MAGLRSTCRTFFTGSSSTRQAVSGYYKRTMYLAVPHLLVARRSSMSFSFRGVEVFFSFIVARVPGLRCFRKGARYSSFEVHVLLFHIRGFC